MRAPVKFIRLFVLTVIALAIVPSARIHADAEFDKLFSAKKYREALEHADAKIPNDRRTPTLWVRIGQANEAVESLERALACYMVAWRLNSGEYDALVGIARIYNKMGQPDQAVSMAENALKVNFTAEASWEFAKACIALNRAADAKAALEKVIASDPSNAVANRELGNIYYNDGEFAKALPLMRRSYRAQADGGVAFRIGRAFSETGGHDSALVYLKRAVDGKSNVVEANAIMARILIEKRNHKAALEHVEFLSAQQPNNLDYLRMLAVCYDAVNNKDKLADADRRIAALDKNDVPSRMRLADFAQSKNDLATAQAMLREASALDSKNETLHRRLAAVARERKQFADAAAAMRKYLELKPNDAEAHRDLGDILYEHKNLDGALAAYRAAVKVDPNIKGFHKRYAEIMIAKGQAAEVITSLNAVIKNGEADVGTYTTLGTVYHSRKQYREAIEAFTQALKLEPSNFDALTSLGASQMASGNVSAAVITFEQAVMMNPDAAQEYKTLGDLYTRQKKGAEAMRAYIRYLDKVPTDRAVAASVGRLLFQEEKFADAAKYLSLSQTNDPTLLLLYADASLKSDNPKNAIGALEKLRDRRPRVSNFNSATLLLAEAYEKDGQTVKAAQTYAEYIAIPGVKDSVAAFKAAFLQEKENPGAAIRIYEANIKAFPNDVRNSLRLGLLYSQRGENAKALPHLRRSTALADADPKLWLDIAQVYEAMRMDKEELEAYQKFIRANPQHVEANKRVGTLLMRRGDYNNAMVNLEIANTMAPNDPAVLSLLARGYVRTNRSREAIDLLTRAKRGNPKDTEIRYQLYELYVAAGQKQQALNEIKELYDMKKEPRFMLPYGDALIAAGRVKEAEAIVDALLDKEPENIQAQMLSALILRSQRKFEDAIEVYKMVNDLAPDYAPGFFEHAETQMQLPRPSPPRAEMLYNRALRADPQYAMAHLGLAKIFRTRNTQQARDQYKKHLETAQKLAPDNELIQEELKRAAGGK